MKFKLVSKFKPAGDQPKAIRKITSNLKSGIKDQVLLGVTGSGKTFVMSNTITKTQKPTLIISHNKTLAAQLYQEFKEFFPKNAVHYFVSYYDYYQPEAYIPQTNTYIEKDAKINKEIDKMRHAAVQDVLTRNDVIIIASVSCIYNIGSPEVYEKISLNTFVSQKIKRKDFISHLISLQYQRDDKLNPGNFRIRGDTIDVFPSTGKEFVRFEFWGDKIEKIFLFKDKSYVSLKNYKIFPSQFWTAPFQKIDVALTNIKGELQQQIKSLKKENKLLESERIRQRTKYDLETLKESGYCYGIENYSQHLEFRKPGSSPSTLLDYFPLKNSLIFIDESHITIPQLNAMYNTDRKRKEVLINHGFRLPSALDNRPLSFKEFEKKTNKKFQNIYVSATPGYYEKKKSFGNIIEQVIRPTGLLEPSIEIRKTEKQIENLIEEVKKRKKNKERVLVITLTKRLAEEISEYFQKRDINAYYLHSEIKTLERPGILEKLRRGEYDALIGINLLREGLDLPEVSLVAILDADKEGFLRNETTLIQTMGRASRNPRGHVILYADKKTYSIKKAVKEITRRRRIQEEYNKEKGIIPSPITKGFRNWPFFSKEKVLASEFWQIKDVNLLKKEMKKAAQSLDFERAAEIRDLIKKIK